ncbi:MAG TPA: Bax inhibitor-1 family protein, partial [Pyrinomonadaceae bacterium]|nr:Bax inhibitor-1 family protein [Pyrinomonadaceae bacterium]
MNEFKSQNQGYQQPPSWQQQGGWGGMIARTAAEATLPERLAFVRKVYALFFAATLFAVGGVMLGFAVPDLMIAVAEHPYISFFALIGGVLGAQAVRLKPGINLFALFGFTTLTGVIFSPLLFILGRENPSSILEAGVLTVGI